MSQPSSELTAEQLKSLAQQKQAVIHALELRSKAAMVDMDQAVKTLKASGEHYNSAILAGMMTFVKDVEQEVGGYNLKSMEAASLR